MIFRTKSFQETIHYHPGIRAITGKTSGNVMDNGFFVDIADVKKQQVLQKEWIKS